MWMHLVTRKLRLNLCRNEDIGEEERVYSKESKEFK